MDESDRVARQLQISAALPLGSHEELAGVFIDGDDQVRDFEMSIVSMLGDKDVAGLVVTMRDVTVKRELTRELEQRVFRERLWKQMNEIWPHYDEYAEKTDREIPVVVLERI